MLERIATKLFIKEDECEVGCEDGLELLKKLTEALPSMPDFENEQPYWGEDASER